MAGISAEELRKRTEEANARAEANKEKGASSSRGEIANTPIAPDGVSWDDMTQLQKYNYAAQHKNAGDNEPWNRLMTSITGDRTTISPGGGSNGGNSSVGGSVSVDSDIVAAAKAALDAQMATKPNAYTSAWQTQLNDVISKILNREKFTFDLNGDALYQQYKGKYIQQGKMAMGDAIGQASAMTGGYGNSYAQSVGQQMYQKELQNLNDIVPELYQMALDKYNMEGQELYNQYSMLGTEEDRDYGQYRDSVSDWLAERNYLTDRYESERNFQYQKDRDAAADALALIQASKGGGDDTLKEVKDAYSVDFNELKLELDSVEDNLNGVPIPPNEVRALTIVTYLIEGKITDEEADYLQEQYGITDEDVNKVLGKINA